MKRMAFIMDQQVGLRTQFLNWQRAVADDAGIEPTWVEVAYQKDAGLLSRLPFVPGGIKGTLRGIAEIRAGLGKKRFDAALWATWAAKSVPDLVAAAPAFLVMDMTPVQMEEMGALYGYGKGRARFMAGHKRRATDRIYASAAHFFPWSQFVAHSLRADYGVPAERITVVSPGVDLELFRPDADARAADGIVRPLFVGGDFLRKGGDLLLRWIRERRAAGRSDCEVHVVTRDTDLSNEPGLVVHRGVQNNSPELIGLYRSSDLFVLPTRADCYSLVAMEAMASGLPVVITSIGGIPDIVDEGVTGNLIPPDSYGPLREALDLLVGDFNLRQRMSAAARAAAESRFDSRANVRRMLAAMSGVPT